MIFTRQKPCFRMVLSEVPRVTKATSACDQDHSKLFSQIGIVIEASVKFALQSRMFAGVGEGT